MSLERNIDLLIFTQIDSTTGGVSISGKKKGEQVEPIEDKIQKNLHNAVDNTGRHLIGRSGQDNRVGRFATYISADECYYLDSKVVNTDTNGN